MNKKSMAKLSLAAMTAVSAASGFVQDLHAAIVINEVYGGGGSSATTGSYNTDFFELYNNGLTAVDITGYSIRYASATGAFTTGSTNNVGTVPSFSLAPGAFYLISGATAATFGGPALPTADATSNIAAGATAGKVALYAADGTTVLDLVAYGTTSTGGEGLLPAATLSTTLSAQRIVDGVDTNQNGVDFVAAAPTPRATNVVPEPASLGLAAVSSALLLRRRSKTR